MTGENKTLERFIELQSRRIFDDEYRRLKTEIEEGLSNNHELKSRGWPNATEILNELTKERQYSIKLEHQIKDLQQVIELQKAKL